MLIKNVSALSVSVLILFFTITMSANAETTEQEQPGVMGVAELFGLPFNDLPLSQVEKKLNDMGLNSYPSYKTGVVSYSLGPEGILGVTNATLYSNDSNYVTQALLSGVVQSLEKRRTLGEVLVKKYGAPSVGFMNEGFGRGKWFFKEGTMIELHNSTFDVSILYVDERPKVASLSGKIDVEALSNKGL